MAINIYESRQIGIMALRYAVYDTAAGDVTIIVDDKAILGLKFGAVDIPLASNEENTVLYDAIVELNQYFFGQRKSFDVRLKPEGTEFELKVYQYLLTIPYGETRTYEEVAEAVGDKKAAKAVGMAVNRNPIPLFIPVPPRDREKGRLGRLPRRDRTQEEAARDGKSQHEPDVQARQLRRSGVSLWKDTPLRGVFFLPKPFKIKQRG
jgi:methylated-DNA-[protein]-cysteine S-methyltransferase